MPYLIIFILILAILFLASAIRILKEYERGVIFRLGRVIGAKGPGLIILIPVVDRMVKVSLRLVAIQEFMERSQQLFLDQGVPEEAVSVKIQERQTGIARDIAREALDNYDAVVVGRWGVSKLKDLVWGSIAGKLVGHLVHVSLWVVGGTPQAGKVLLAMDASEEAMRTVDYVGAMLAGTDGEVTLFHVMRGLDFVLPETGEILQDIEGAAEAFLEQAVGRLEKAGLRPDQISTKTVSGVASRAKAIVEEAKNGGYGTIVVGRRGLSRVAEFFMGRVSNKVMQLAREMAVLVVS